MERKAWECPRCHKVNAPHVDQCECEPKPENSGMTYDEILKKYFDGQKDKPEETKQTVPTVITRKPWFETVSSGSNYEVDYDGYILWRANNNQ